MKQEIFKCAYKWSLTVCFPPSCPLPRFPCSLSLHTFFFSSKLFWFQNTYYKNITKMLTELSKYRYEVLFATTLFFKNTQHDTQWYKAILSFTTLTLLKVHSLPAWENNFIFWWLYRWLTFLSLKMEQRVERKRLFPFCLIFQIKLFIRSCTYFSTEFPRNLHTLWQIPTIVFRHNCPLNAWAREVHRTEDLPLDS